MEGWIGEVEASRRWNLEKREAKINQLMNLKKNVINRKTVTDSVKLNTSSKNLSQQSELWLAGVWGLMRQLGEAGG